MAIRLKGYTYNDTTGKIERAKRSKYGNRKVEADGYTFDSQAEYARYCELKLELDQGFISDLRVHPTFLLQEGFTDNQGQRHRPIYYEADFIYRRADRELEIVEDVKGKATPDFKIKCKLFLKKYRQYIFWLTKVGKR